MAPKTKGEYVVTEAKNKISRKAKIYGLNNIVLRGNVVIQADVVLRGDLPLTPPLGASKADKRDDIGSTISITIGKRSFLSSGCVVHPASHMSKGVCNVLVLKISDDVFIGENTIVQAAGIHRGCHIGANCVIGPACVIYECCRILDGSVLPGGMVVPAGMVVGGSPARILEEIGVGENGWAGEEAWASIG